MRVASAQWRFSNIRGWRGFESALERILDSAAKQQVQLLLLPEYLGLQLASFSKPAGDSISVVISQSEAYQELFQSLSKKWNMIIQAGTTLAKLPDNNHCANRAYLFTPDGKIQWQDKLFLTPFERTFPLIQRGTEQRLFDTPFGKIAIVICYDSEFPFVTKELVKQGANLILVPTYTETLAGFHRVFISSRARAIENQCFVMQSCLIGNTFLREKDNTWEAKSVGQSGVYCPCDKNFPPSGILAQTRFNSTGIAVVDLDFNQLKEVRDKGEVSNFKDYTLDNYL